MVRTNCLLVALTVVLMSGSLAEAGTVQSSLTCTAGESWVGEWLSQMTDKTCPDTIAASCTAHTWEANYYVFDLAEKSTSRCVYTNRRPILSRCPKQKVAVTKGGLTCFMEPRASGKQVASK